MLLFTSICSTLFCIFIQTKDVRNSDSENFDSKECWLQNCDSGSRSWPKATPILNFSKSKLISFNWNTSIAFIFNFKRKQHYKCTTWNRYFICWISWFFLDQKRNNQNDISLQKAQRRASNFTTVRDKQHAEDFLLK